MVNQILQQVHGGGRDVVEGDGRVAAAGCAVQLWVSGVQVVRPVLLAGAGEKASVAVLCRPALYLGTIWCWGWKGKKRFLPLLSRESPARTPSRPRQACKAGCSYKSVARQYRHVPVLVPRLPGVAQAAVPHTNSRKPTQHRLIKIPRLLLPSPV